jgi:hypothetical protein
MREYRRSSASAVFPPRAVCHASLSQHTDAPPTVQRNRFRYELVCRRFSREFAPDLWFVPNMPPHFGAAPYPLDANPPN